MAESESGVSRRKCPLYTSALTPLCDVSDDLWAVIGPILSPAQSEHAPQTEVFPWLQTRPWDSGAKSFT